MEDLATLAEVIKQEFSLKELESKIGLLIDSEPMESIKRQHELRLAEIMQKHEADAKRRHHALALFLIEISTPQGIRDLTR
jgi:hypothetical protein